MSTIRCLFITRESSYYSQRVLAIAILSVRPSVRHTGGSVKSGASYRIIKSTPSAA